MTAPDHLKITGPEDILGFIPHSLGYWPDSSLVAMTLQGKMLGATLRVDLPVNTAGGDAASAVAWFARNVASYLGADDEADGSLLALFTGDDGDGAAWAPLLAELAETLAEAGMPVRDAWLVGARFWRNAYCADASCCAPPGRPVEEIRNSPLNAEMVFRGSTVGTAPGDPLPEPSGRRGDPAVLAAERDWAELFAGRWREHRQFSQTLDVWTRVLAAPLGQQLPPGLAGYLRATLCVPAWRDAVLVMAAAGKEAALRGAEDFGVVDRGPSQGSAGPADNPGAGGPEQPRLPPFDGFPAPNDDDPVGGRADATLASGVPGYGEVLLGVAPSVPDWGLMGRLDRVFVVLGGAGGEAGAAALTGRGWIEWCRGRGSHADALFTLAGTESPGYRLAELLSELVRRGTLCGWAGRKDAAWQKFGPDAA